jgi:predicted chitinase
MKMKKSVMAVMLLTVSSLCAQARPVVDEPSIDEDIVNAQESTDHSLAKAAAVWAEGNTYTAGTVVSYNGQLYTALVTHTAFVGANWNPAATPSLWKAGGTDSGGGGGGGGTGGTAGITAGATYKLINPNSGLALDVSGCGTSNGTNVQVWADGIGVCGSGVGQAWKPNLNADGTYTLVNPNSSNALDVAGCGTGNGTNVQTWANGIGVCNNGAGQKWRINANGDGTYTLVNPNSNKALDVAGAGRTNGTNVILYDQNNGVAQKWRFATWTATNGGGGGGGGGGSFAVTEAQFNQMFPNRNGLYTYAGLQAAANSFPGFATTGSDTIKRQEIAAFLANVAHESDSLKATREYNMANWPLYCDPSSGCAPGQQYYGRGPIQLSWNYNYRAAGNALGIDLWSNPDLVATDATIAWKTAVWYWMTGTGAAGITPHNAMINSQGFGVTIRAINGSLECNGGRPDQVQARINFYNTFTGIIGVAPGGNLGC